LNEKHFVLFEPISKKDGPKLPLNAQKLDKSSQNCQMALHIQAGFGIVLPENNK
jgi:hypothetical protein